MIVKEGQFYILRDKKGKIISIHKKQSEAEKEEKKRKTPLLEKLRTILGGK